MRMGMRELQVDILRGRLLPPTDTKQALAMVSAQVHSWVFPKQSVGVC